MRSQNLPVLPALLQTAMLALLTTSIPLSMTLTSTLIAIDFDGELVSDPPPRQMESAASVHVLAFSPWGELLLVESEGGFGIDTWEKVYTKAKQVCRGHKVEEDDDEEAENMNVYMDINGISSKEDVLRSIIQEQAGKDRRWKEG